MDCFSSLLVSLKIRTAVNSTSCFGFSENVVNVLSGDIKILSAQYICCTYMHWLCWQYINVKSALQLMFKFHFRSMTIEQLTNKN